MVHNGHMIPNQETYGCIYFINRIPPNRYKYYSSKGFFDIFKFSCFFYLVFPKNSKQIWKIKKIVVTLCYVMVTWLRTTPLMIKYYFAKSPMDIGISVSKGFSLSLFVFVFWFFLNSAVLHHPWMHKGMKKRGCIKH